MASRYGDGHSRPAPSAVGDVLAESRKFALERSRAPLDRYSYSLAVGRRIAERTELGELRRGELTVYVASPAWAQELTLLAPEMIGRLKERGVAVQRLRFRLQREDQKKPMRAAAAAGAAPVSRKVLPPDLAAKLARVGDDELRDAIADAAGLALGRAEREEREAHERSQAAARAATKTSRPPGARGPRGAEAQSGRTGSSSPPARATSADTRAKRRG